MVNNLVEAVNMILPEPQAGLLNGIIFGIKSSLPADFYQALIATGTIHIVVLSGQNISILTRILAGFTLPLGRRNSLLITFLGLVSYIMVIGVEPALIRAFLMGSMSLIAVYFGRLSWSMLSLFLAAGMMLLVKPGWIGDMSFQLSFLATLGIILFGPAVITKPQNLLQEITSAFRINLQTTLAAQLFTIPLILFRFERFSLVAPLTNVLIGWTITPIMLSGMTVSLAGWLFLPLGQLLSWLVWVPLTYVVWIVDVTSKIPWSSLSF